MDDRETLTRLDELIAESGMVFGATSIVNFLDKARAAADIIKSWPKKKRDNTAWLLDFAKRLNILEGSFSLAVERDPMILYKPAHLVSSEFHKSNAFIRYYKAGNRTSKTTTGYAEHYWAVTYSHPWRKTVTHPVATFVIGTGFSKYAPNVFEKKLITGEPGNILSPMFPEGGKWLYKYDNRKHIVYLCCEECAKADRAQDCSHPKSTITLFSDLEGYIVLQGGQYNLGHFDEHIKEEFFNEGIQRLMTVPYSGLIVTGTPVDLGFDSWEYRKLSRVFVSSDKKENQISIPNEDGIRQYVSLHTISQRNAGLVPLAQIEAAVKGMDPLEIRARIDGEHVSLAKQSVFDRTILHEMEHDIKDPECVGFLRALKPLKDVLTSASIEFTDNAEGELSIWEPPIPGAQYVIGCDVAGGLSDGGDYSCASVVKIPSLDLVAQYHARINPLKYADELYKLGYYYEMSLIAVERTGGLGVGVICRLMELGYMNLFRNMSDPTSSEPVQQSVFGVDTNQRSKPHMISCLQQVIRERGINIPSAATMEELKSFGQHVSDSGLTYRYRGESGCYDDRVMSLVIAVFIAVTYQVYDFSKDLQRLKKKENENKVFNNIWDDIHRQIDGVNPLYM